MTERQRVKTRDAFCVGCGNPFVSRIRGGKGPRWTRYCSKACFGANATYKGGPEASRRRRRYGMEPEEFDRRLGEQEYRCALCRREFEDGKIYVDHDHATKANRSLLCPRCNQIAGVFDQLNWADIMLFWGYTRHHEDGVALAVAASDAGREFFV